MNSAILEAELISQCILACETPENDLAQALAAAQIIEKLRLYSTKVLGIRGFHMLLSRALVLTTRQMPWMASVQVNYDGTLAGFEEAVQAQNAGAAAKGRMALLTQVLALFITFIGLRLTLCLAQEIWTNTPLEDLSFSTKDIIQ